MNPFVSVIIPTYNRARLVTEAVASVLRQTYRKFEVIVVDDGSTDETEDLLQNTCDVQYIKKKHSGMPGEVRNYGVARCGGSLIAFLDSDDLWLPDKLEKQVTLLVAKESGAKNFLRICHTREIWKRDGEVVSQKGQRHKREGDIFEDALHKCIIGPSTVLMERALFEETGGFREDLEIAEDYEYWLRICDKEQIGYIDAGLIEKRAGHGQQLSEKYGQIEFFRIQALQELVDRRAFLPEHMRSAAAKLAEKCLIYAAGCRKRYRLDEALRYEKYASYYNAFHWEINP